MLAIAGTQSGCGKSTVTLGVLAALKKTGHTVQPFKAGPDFIDPGLHGRITGRPGRNLDLWMCGKKYVRESVKKHTAGADCAVMEGVMGLFDGGRRSTARLADFLEANTVLVINAYGMAESAAAIARGFQAQGNGLSGVIFNSVSGERHYERLKKAVSKYAKPLGYLPRRAEFSIPERHLGLTVAEESPINKKAINKLADAVLKHIDIESLALLAGIEERRPEEAKHAPARARLAVARDKAFCFYYEDNLDMLREAGAKILFFSPLKDKKLPSGIDGLYLGGGYPELYGAALSKNQKMLSEVKDFARAGGAVYAECGGLMYLSKGIYLDGKFHPMCGVFPFRAAMRKENRPVLGYREIELPSDSILGRKGWRLRGHEFHYSEILAPPPDSRGDERGVTYNIFGEPDERNIEYGAKAPWVSSALYKNTLASYVHVHFGSNKKTAAHFVRWIKEKETWR